MAVALAAAKDAFSQRLQERGNNNAKFWSTSVLAALGGDRHWLQVGLRQLRCACSRPTVLLCLTKLAQRPPARVPAVAC